MTVYLVGGGPGDPGLITVRGRDLLANCDAIVYDALANPILLEKAPVRVGPRHVSLQCRRSAGGFEKSQRHMSRSGKARVTSDNRRKAVLLNHPLDFGPAALVEKSWDVHAARSPLRAFPSQDLLQGSYEPLIPITSAGHTDHTSGAILI